VRLRVDRGTELLRRSGGRRNLGVDVRVPTPEHNYDSTRARSAQLRLSRTGARNPLHPVDHALMGFDDLWGVPVLPDERVRVKRVRIACDGSPWGIEADLAEFLSVDAQVNAG
jgi:hypothetical protein